MDNEFEGRSEAWLLERRAALQEVIAAPEGAQTHTGIAAGIFHEYEAMSPKQLRDVLLRVRYALWCLNPATYTNPLTGKTMRVTTIHC